MTHGDVTLGRRAREGSGGFVFARHVYRGQPLLT
jgi:hypothetical protein